jgi:hypothetical protein
MGPREIAETDELLQELSRILSTAKPGRANLKYGEADTNAYRAGLAELRTHSVNLIKDFPSNAFPLVARAAKKFSNRVNALVVNFPGSVASNKKAIEELTTIWFLDVRPEIYTVEFALAVTVGVLLPEDPTMFRGKDGYLRQIVFEINRCYRSGSYNACSVIMRRLLETLIIQVHEKKGTTASAKNASGAYFHLEKLIDDLVGTNPFNLTRNSLDALPRLKRIGDWGAHNRNILIRETDIENIKADARVCFEELLRQS